MKMKSMKTIEKILKKMRMTMLIKKYKLIIWRADSGMWQPSSSSPSGHWGIKSHLDKCLVLMMTLIIMLLNMVIITMKMKR